MTDDEPNPPHIIIGGITPHVRGSKRHTCFKCGETVWLAPSSIRFIPNAVPVCLECGREMIEQDSHPVFMPPTDEQLAEVIDIDRGKHNG